MFYNHAVHKTRRSSSYNCKKSSSSKTRSANFKKFIALFTCVLISATLVFAASACTTTQNGTHNNAQNSTNTTASNSSNTFEYWNADAQSLSTLKEYVADITNTNSQNYVPENDRIAVFDVDGTLYGELAPIYVEWNMYAYRVLNDPTYTCTDPEMIRVANEIVQAGKTKVITDNIEKEHAHYAQVAFAGMTIDQYCNYVEEYLQKPAEGFDNATYADMWFLPMLNVIDYLNANNFTVYVVSGTDRIMVREMIKNRGVGIEWNNVIGMDCQFSVAGKEGQDLLDYQLSPEDKIVRSSELLVKTVKMNKAAQMAREIGKKPILSFGNSSGDISMATYVTSDNPYKSAAFMLVADDTERDYGNATKAEELKEKWTQHNWNCISMKNDFATIYDTKVTKKS